MKINPAWRTILRNAVFSLIGIKLTCVGKIRQVPINEIKIKLLETWLLIHKFCYFIHKRKLREISILIGFPLIKTFNVGRNDCWFHQNL